MSGYFGKENDVKRENEAACEAEAWVNAQAT